MEMRTFDKLGVTSSILGFGCMRFPTIDGIIDEERSKKMIWDAMDKGVTYIDTAYPYHQGLSEAFVGRALKDRDRSTFTIATKMPLWACNTLEEAKAIFAEQLERLQMDYVDFYMLHAMDKVKFQKAKDLGIITFCEELKEKGLIKHFGFSFHDNYEAFEEIIKYRDWDFCQLQLNYMDMDIQAGLKGHNLAEELGVPVIVMEPIKGGALASFGPEINGMFHEMDATKSIASFAMRYVAALSNVKVILSGMSTEEQVEDNLDTFINYVPYTQEDLAQVTEIVKAIKARVQNGCTGCKYCMPCPVGIDIPGVFAAWNKMHMYSNKEQAMNEWTKRPDSEKPVNCIKCGKCETVCPQQIKIREDLDKVDEAFKA
ncbi:MAG: aldo/keto reductase [Lachnospiraceae bacterium]